MVDRSQLRLVKDEQALTGASMQFASRSLQRFASAARGFALVRGGGELGNDWCRLAENVVRWLFWRMRYCCMRVAEVHAYVCLRVLVVHQCLHNESVSCLVELSSCNVVSFL